jgi:hypothetical protein
VNEQRLREALRAVPEDPAARARTLRVLREAYRSREPLWAPRRRWVLAVAAVLAAGVIAGAAASAPGDAVARWVRDVLGVRHEDARPALGRVPGGGRLLVTVSSGGAAWVVAADGSRRRLGDYTGASWSPSGRFVVAWRGGDLVAAEPGGRVRWSLSRRGTISWARWAPVDGFRIAYVLGGTLRIVNGDGTGDRRYGAARRGVAPAWRPDASHVLAYVARGRVHVATVDARRELWRSPRLTGVRELEWSPDGHRLLVAAARGLVVYGGRGRVLARRAIVADDVAWSPRGERFAVVRRRAASSEVMLVGRRSRVLFTGPGRFGRVAWSPSGRRLLVPWPEADQWLFLSTAGAVAVANIERQFAGGPGRPDFPDAVEWCCR